MVRLSDIHSLTGFLRDHKAFLERLASTGRPEVLTVNGRARVVIQDAESYQKMLEVLDSIDTERVLRERLGSLDRGDAGIPAEKVLSEVRARLGHKRK